MGCLASAPAGTSDGENESKSDVNERYVFTRTLGKGASCRVMEATSKKDNAVYAVKIMSKSRPVCKPLYEHEVSILSKLKHPNIVCLHENFEDDENFYVVTNMCAGGELFDRIVDPNFQITEKIASSLVRDMLKALQCCHSKNIVHRDLKPENFVFEGKEADANIVLIDFGCAKEVQDDEVYEDLVGTVYYLAPELASQKKDVPTTGLVLKSADVWSVGVITYVMLTGRPPFGGKSNREIFQRIVTDPLLFPDDVKLSDAFKDFVRQALVKDPSKRITLEAALEHPWVIGKDAPETELQKEVIRYLRQFNYQSKLKKAITRCLAANMSKEPEQEVKRHFNRLDKDGDGFLELNELEQFLLDMGYAPSIAKDEAKKMLANADLNKDGTIDFNEFKAVWQRKLLSQHEEYIHRVFAVFDDNGDGYIDANELQGVLGDDFKSIVEMINEVDENKDSKISFDEFKKAMKEDVTKLEDGIAGGKIREQDLA